MEPAVSLRSGSVKLPWLWAAVAGLLIWGLIAAAYGKAGLPPLPIEGHGNDLQMYEVITKRVAGGEGYYRVLADELPSRGYAVRPLFNWRLPTLTWLNALPPSPLWGRILFDVLGAAVIVLWVAAIRKSVPRMAAICLPVLMLANGPLVMFRSAVFFYEIWTGWLIAASLACWALGRWRISIAIAAAALAIRELALPFVVIMAAVAWWEGRRKEAAAWAGVVVLFMVFWLFHAWQILPVLPPDGLRNQWAVAGGWPFVLSASQSSLFLMLLSEQWAAAILVPLLWAGSWYWRDAIGRRLASVMTGYFCAFMVIGRPDNWYWGFVIAPLIPLGAFGYFYGLPPRAPRWRKKQS